MTDNTDNVVPFVKSGPEEETPRDGPGEAILIDGPMLVEDWASAIYEQIRIVNPECFDVDGVNFLEIQRILRGVAYYGIRGEEPRRRP
jgi:hypothetical protein